MGNRRGTSFFTAFKCMKGWGCGGNHLAIFKCIQLTCCIPQTYTMLYVSYMSINLGEKKIERLKINKHLIEGDGIKAA